MPPNDHIPHACLVLLGVVYPLKDRIVRHSQLAYCSSLHFDTASRGYLGAFYCFVFAYDRRYVIGVTFFELEVNDLRVQELHYCCELPHGVILIFLRKLGE